MITDANRSRPTEVQLAARELADVLLAGNAIRKVPKKEVTMAWMRFGELAKATPSKNFPKAYGKGKAYNAATLAIERMQLVDEGGALIVDMPKLLKRGAKVGVIFGDEPDLPANETGFRHTNANFFKPIDERALRYDICVVWVPDSGPLEDVHLLKKYRLGLSHMADSVFHELLHIWFIHKFPTPPGQRQELGHSGGLDDKEFSDRMHRFQDQMLALDKALRR